MKTELKSIYNGMSRDIFDKLLGTNSYIEVPWFGERQYPCTIIKNTYVIGYAGYSGVDSRPITESSYGALNYWCIQYSGITGWGTYYFFGNEYDELQSLDGPSSPIDKDNYKDLFINCKYFKKKKMETKELEFKSLTTEKYRVYEWPDGFKITVTKPIKLNVSASGGHRILDYAGISHYIPSGWRHLYWEVYEGELQFTF